VAEFSTLPPWRSRLLVGTALNAILTALLVGGALFWFTWGSRDASGEVLHSVDPAFLAEHFDVDITPDWSGLPTRITREAALAIIDERSPSDAQRVEEMILANVRTRIIGGVRYEGRAWVVSIAKVVPHTGGPIPIEGKCLVPESWKYTLDNTFFMYLIDAETGDILSVFGGTTEAIFPEPDCTVVPPVSLGG